MAPETIDNLISCIAVLLAVGACFWLMLKEARRGCDYRQDDDDQS